MDFVSAFRRLRERGPEVLRDKRGLKSVFRDLFNGNSSAVRLCRLMTEMGIIELFFAVSSDSPEKRERAKSESYACLCDEFVSEDVAASVIDALSEAFEWNDLPGLGSSIKKGVVPCPSCGKPVGSDFMLCPYCGEMSSGVNKSGASELALRLAVEKAEKSEEHWKSSENEALLLLERSYIERARAEDAQREAWIAEKERFEAAERHREIELRFEEAKRSLDAVAELLDRAAVELSGALGRENESRLKAADAVQRADAVEAEAEEARARADDARRKFEECSELLASEKARVNSEMEARRLAEEESRLKSESESRARAEEVKKRLEDAKRRLEEARNRRIVEESGGEPEVESVECVEKGLAEDPEGAPLDSDKAEEARKRLEDAKRKLEDARRRSSYAGESVEAAFSAEDEVLGSDASAETSTAESEVKDKAEEARKRLEDARKKLDEVRRRAGGNAGSDSSGVLDEGPEGAVPGDFLILDVDDDVVAVADDLDIAEIDPDIADDDLDISIEDVPVDDAELDVESVDLGDPIEDVPVDDAEPDVESVDLEDLRLEDLILGDQPGDGGGNEPGEGGSEAEKSLDGLKKKGVSSDDSSGSRAGDMAGLLGMDDLLEIDELSFEDE